MRAISFFTPVVGWHNSMSDGVEDYFYLFRGKKAFVTPWKKIKGGEVVDLHDPKDSIVRRVVLAVLKIFSYLTIIIPAIMIIAKIAFRSSHHFFMLSEKEMGSRKTIQKIGAVLDKVIEYEEDDSFIFYRCQPGHRVFSLKSLPDLIFKMAPEKNEKVEERFKKRSIAQKICSRYGLDLLIFPKAVLVEVGLRGEKYTIIVEEKLDVNCDDDVQKSYYRRKEASLLRAECQLVRLIVHTKFSDVNFHNCPVLPSSLDAFGNRRIAILDYEETDSEDVGIFGCNESLIYRQGLLATVSPSHGQAILREVKKHLPWTEQRNQLALEALARNNLELQQGQKLDEYYRKRNIIHGNEQLTVDVEMLIPRKGKKADTLKTLAKAVEKVINDTVSKPSSKSIQERRTIYINTNDTGTLFCSMERKYPHKKKKNPSGGNESYLEIVVKALIKEGYLFSFKRNCHGYFLQA